MDDFNFVLRCAPEIRHADIGFDDDFGVHRIQSTDEYQWPVFGTPLISHEVNVVFSREPEPPTRMQPEDPSDWLAGWQIKSATTALEHVDPVSPPAKSSRPKMIGVQYKFLHWCKSSKMRITSDPDTNWATLARKIRKHLQHRRRNASNFHFLMHVNTHHGMHVFRQMREFDVFVKLALVHPDAHMIIVGLRQDGVWYGA
jgi:hypothetical protein